MTRISFIISLLGGLILSFSSPVKPPHKEITNGLIKAQLFMPELNTGYYQATRFDWSGVISSLNYKNHSYFGQWSEKEYDPLLHDAIMGPVQEFGPLGYDDVKAGEHFIKIGVGALRKIEEKGYRYTYTYEIADPGKWTVETKKDCVKFIHELTDETGYSYVYTKTVRLIKGKPVMVLEHSLKNTGRKSIQTSVYNHNFFVIDNEPTGPNIKMSFPYEIKANNSGQPSLKGFGTIADVQGNSIMYKRTLNKGEQVYSNGLLGYRNIPEDYDIRLENVKTGAGVKITSDQAIEKLVYWANPNTSCAEPYIKIVALPEKEVKWKYNYEFYTLEPDKK